MLCCSYCTHLSAFELLGYTIKHQSTAKTTTATTITTKPKTKQKKQQCTVKYSTHETLTCTMLHCKLDWYGFKLWKSRLSVLGGFRVQSQRKQCRIPLDNKCANPVCLQYNISVCHTILFWCVLNIL